jgi:hypothetical protein
MVMLDELLKQLGTKPGVIRHKIVGARDDGLVRIYKFTQSMPNGKIRDVHVEINVEDIAGNNATMYDPTALDIPTVPPAPTPVATFTETAKGAFMSWANPKSEIESWELVKSNDDAKYAIFATYEYDQAKDMVEKKMKIAVQGKNKILVRPYNGTMEAVSDYIKSLLS